MHSKWEFRPGLWPSIATALLLPLLLWLGFWQLDRAEQKHTLEQRYQDRRSQAAVELGPASAVESDPGLLWRSARLRGEYQTDMQFLLDNQVHRGRAGYLVFTPLRVSGGGPTVLVNRGWIPAGQRRDEVPDFPTPTETVLISGVIKTPPDTGLVLEGSDMQVMAPGLIRLQHMELASIAGRIQGDLYPWVVRLSGADAGGVFVRDWEPPGYGRERHLGYALQWFALAATLIILYLVLNTRRRSQDD